MSSAISTLRKWLRWKRRAEELKVGLPDPTILVRGLSKLVKRILQGMPDLSFRLSLVRNILMIDTVPSHESVSRYSEHLLAELEQAGHQTKKKEQQVEAPKLKRLEGQQKEDGSGQKEGSPTGRFGGEKKKCRFFLTEGGCRRGKECQWLHEKDDKRRCWTCGAEDHFATTCSRPKGKEQTLKKVSKFEGEESPSKKKAEEIMDQSSTAPMKGLLEEASRMLKTMSSSSSSNTSSASSAKEDEEKKDVMERLHEQLKSLKVFKINRLKKDGKMGLVDSGATNSLRARRDNEEVDGYAEAEVSLADGRTVRLKISPGGAMLTEDKGVEPIVPMGLLATKLNCKMRWEEGELKIQHPQQGDIKVVMAEGCPHVQRHVALQLISELEDVKKGVPVSGDFKDEEEWMKQLVDQHPVLRSLPEHLRQRLAVQVGSWSDLPSNRRQSNGMVSRCTCLQVHQRGLLSRRRCRSMGEEKVGCWKLMF